MIAILSLQNFAWHSNVFAGLIWYSVLKVDSIGGRNPNTNRVISKNYHYYYLDRYIIITIIIIIIILYYHYYHYYYLDILCHLDIHLPALHLTHNESLWIQKNICRYLSICLDLFVSSKKSEISNYKMIHIQICTHILLYIVIIYIYILLLYCYIVILLLLYCYYIYIYIIIIITYYYILLLYIENLI